MSVRTLNYLTDALFVCVAVVCLSCCFEQLFFLARIEHADVVVAWWLFPVSVLHVTYFDTLNAKDHIMVDQPFVITEGVA